MRAALWLPLTGRRAFVCRGWNRLHKVTAHVPQVGSHSKVGSRNFSSHPLTWRGSLQHSGDLPPRSRECEILRTSGFVTNALSLSAPLVGAVSRHAVRAPVCTLARKGFTARVVSCSPAANCFHTSARAPALPFPLILLLLKPVKKILAMILGRSIRNWWQGLPSHKQELLKHSVRRNKWRIVLGVCGLTGLVTAYLWLHYDTSQITGRSRLLVFSQRQLLELAAIEYESMLKTYEGTLLPKTDQAYQTVQFVFNHLVEKNKDVPGMSRIEWNINVVQDPEINAFILPNGQVFVLTGMLSAVADTDQLACILGHEMAHCLLAHGAEHASFVQLLDFLSLITLTLIWAVFPRDSLALLGQWVQSKLVQYMFSRPYSRKLETEADEVGLQLAAKACVDVRAGCVFWQQLELLKMMSGRSKTPDWFSTHPSNESRIEHLNQQIPQAVKLREVCGCSALPSIDPRLVFKLSLQELLQASKKSEDARHTDPEAELPLRDPDPKLARLEKIPVALPAQTPQASTLSPK